MLPGRLPTNNHEHVDGGGARYDWAAAGIPLGATAGRNPGRAPGTAVVGRGYSRRPACPWRCLRTVVPQWTPPDYADGADGLGRAPASSALELRVRIEAAAHRGKPVFLCGRRTVDAAAARGSRPKCPRATASTMRSRSPILVALLVSAMLIARRNFRTGRADRARRSRGALHDRRGPRPLARGKPPRRRQPPGSSTASS